jgi:hypothetical protein
MVRGSANFRVDWGEVDGYKSALRNNPNDDETRYNFAFAQKLLKKEKH